MGMHGMHGGGFGGGGIVMCLLFLLLIGAVIFMMKRGAYGPPWARRGFGGGFRPGPGAPSDGQAPGAQPQFFGPWGQPVPRPEDEALKVLADRLANGDITPDEYLQRVSVLRQQGTN